MNEYIFNTQTADLLLDKFHELKKEIAKVIVGQDEVVNLLLTAIFCEGHCLLVGVPGLAKTLLIHTIAQTLSLNFNRIQFTPDLMPSDILGSETLDKDRNLKFVKGAIFANIILADEINRTPPKTQSALLEAMQEYCVTTGGQTYKLDRPFFVLATQNPIEQEGTYPLPEAQLDRFMFNLTLDYPSYKSEVEIVRNMSVRNSVQINPILSIEEIRLFQAMVKSKDIVVPDNVVEFAVQLVHATRPNTELASPTANQYLDWGAGPRASQYLILAAKCHCLLSGEKEYSPNEADVIAVAKPILRHRIVRNFKAEAEGMTTDKIIDKLITEISAKRKRYSSFAFAQRHGFYRRSTYGI
ncbi:MAG: AAA family ATPase [Bacteroidetes bacterium]|nr:MAG: AAA family ATPase [Bacteroidota bacterium]